MNTTRVPRSWMTTAVCGRDYKLLRMKKLYPPYWEDGIWMKCGLYSYQYRSYKTWKHNRKTQYKQLNK